MLVSYALFFTYTTPEHEFEQIIAFQLFLVIEKSQKFCKELDKEAVHYKISISRAPIKCTLAQ